jgi:hypothetical protein
LSSLALCLFSKSPVEDLFYETQGLNKLERLIKHRSASKVLVIVFIIFLLIEFVTNELPELGVTGTLPAGFPVSVTQWTTCLLTLTVSFNFPTCLWTTL